MTSADISLRGKLVIYDNVKHKIGWQPSDCIRSRKSKSFPPFWGEGTFLRELCTSQHSCL
ncbi:aspartyl protease apcb1 [Quercus suber]|uniref:Aspartyl protease apcb1 n=1 Tax=Quercus suber TaxID=58331 RepID=A0AAW0LW94_QUESU